MQAKTVIWVLSKDVKLYTFGTPHGAKTLPLFGHRGNPNSSALNRREGSFQRVVSVTSIDMKLAKSLNQFSQVL